MLFIGICLHHQAFFKIFHHGVSKLNQPDESQNDAELLRKLVQFRVLVKECVLPRKIFPLGNEFIFNQFKSKWISSFFLESADVYSPYILCHLVGTMIYFAVAVFQLDLVIFGFCIQSFFCQKKTSIFFSKKKSCNFSFFLQEFKHFDFNVISIKIVIVTAMWNLLVYCFKEMPTDNWSWQGSHCSKRHLSSFIMRISHSLFRSKESY